MADPREEVEAVARVMAAEVHPPSDYLDWLPTAERAIAALDAARSSAPAERGESGAGGGCPFHGFYDGHRCPVCGPEA